MTSPTPIRGKLFTGRRRARRPKRAVRIADRIARGLITMGGIGSIVAVSLVGLFLVYVVVPLFLPPSMPETGTFARTDAAGDGRLAHLAVNEYLTMSWEYCTDGTVVVRRLDDGSELERLQIGDEIRPDASAFAIEGDGCVFGFSDGTIRLGSAGFDTEFLAPDDVPSDIRGLASGASAPLGNGMVERTRSDQYRRQQFELELDEPMAVAEAPIVLVDRSAGMGDGVLFAALDARGKLYVTEVSRRRNLLTGETATTLTGGELDLLQRGIVRRDAKGEPLLPAFLLMTGIGDNVMLGWRDGRLVRILTRDVTDLRFVEETDLVPEGNAALTVLGFQLGKASLIAGDSLGRVRVWFRINPEGTATEDGTVLVMAHELPPGEAAVTALRPSARARMVAVGYANGHCALDYITSDNRLADVTLAEGRPIVAVALAPRDDRLLAATADRMELWRVDATHPEVNLKALFGKIWYEGYNEPEYVWQSSAASDSFEPKYSLVPLIFGTLKATFYSMLIGLPLALLAAIYTSEFLHPRVKARVKPVIEMMASLPSVVLGFLAALVFAPFVEKVVPQTLTAFAAIPFAFLLGAHLWQLVPRQLQLRFERAKLPLMLLMLPLGIWLAALFGPLAERALFAGDIMSWLDGQIGSGLGAWVIILLPLSAALVAYGNARLVNPWLRGSRREWTRVRFALVDLLRFLVSSGAVLVVALALSGFFSSAGWDPRGAYVDTYVQRNALIVGFVMGFAIIPIIYTISDDALAAVPDHLRAASLGAGATPWQTAMLVVVPPAMSGLFSATMIGLGRAVGETMIVLMAAGNTPLIDWNIFNGFRTLSANIAVELPEAVQNSAHYRTLFLAALTLFLMTFVLNTVAEAVRTHYRKKAFEL